MHKTFLAFLLGVVVSYGAAIFAGAASVPFTHSDEHTHTHPIGYANSADEVHVHSDFILYLNGTEYDLTDEKYMSSAEAINHEHIHLHDGKDEVIHRHAHDITLADFFDSLGFTLTDTCITTDTGEEFCSNTEQQLLLFINSTPTTTIGSYVNQEADQLLIYYGDPNNPIIPELLNSISDKACIYSGTCPERGTPPPEACGLTCEI